KRSKFGPKVVLHLHGSGERPLTPVRVKGSSLVLYFEPAPDRGAEEQPAAAPLVLAPPTTSTAAQGALIDVEDGDLHVLGGEFRLPNFKLALVPDYLLRVRGGDLYLRGCRLRGPLTQGPANSRALVRFEVPGGKTRSCVLEEVVLVSGKAG